MKRSLDYHIRILCCIESAALAAVMIIVARSAPELMKWILIPTTFVSLYVLVIGWHLKNVLKMLQSGQASRSKQK